MKEIPARRRFLRNCGPATAPARDNSTDDFTTRRKDDIVALRTQQTPDDDDALAGIAGVSLWSGASAS
jgi:hypothetical protein